MDCMKDWNDFRKGENPTPAPPMRCACCEKMTPEKDSHRKNGVSMHGDIVDNETGEEMTVCRRCGPQFDEDCANSKEHKS